MRCTGGPPTQLCILLQAQGWGWTSRVARCLLRWARWAEADRQTSLLRLLLSALHALPIPWAMLRNSGLHRAVARLQKYRCVGALVL